MYRRIVLIALLALVASCAPTALPRPESGSPSAPSPSAIATTDLITLREGGADSYLAVRKVSTGELVRQLPDGGLLGDGTTIIAVETAAFTTTVRAVDRRTGATLRSRSIPGVWTLRGIGIPLAGTLSPNGAFAALVGSSYAYTDASGAWTAKTSLAVVDTSLAAEPTTIELAGRYAVDAISNDGRALYLVESAPAQLPTSARLRVYDLAAREFGSIAGDDVPDPNAGFRTQSATAGRFTFELFAGRTPVLLREDLDGRAMRTLQLPAEQGVLGEQVLMWSLVGSRDGRTLYAINAALGVIDEIDVASLTLRRSAPLSATRSESGILDAIATALHPIALAKRGVSRGAVLSQDGATLYAIGDTGMWSIETSSLKARQLTKDGTYTSVALSPDGARIYALGEDVYLHVLSARDGTSVGVMARIAWPSDIVAVDAAP